METQTAAPAASSHAPSAPATDDRTRAELARVAAYAVLRIVRDDEIADMLRTAAMRGAR